MSFQIKDKRKIQLLRKCVTILTQDSEELSMHFTKTDIRFFTQQEDCTTYMCDFSASWFSKFVAPDYVLRGEGDRMQVTCHRDTFLQSFNLIDDTELEFMVEIREQDEGALKVLKTRDMVIVESSMVFRIDQDVICDETYIFPNDQLLIKARLDSMNQVKHIFRQNAKAEVLQLDFTPQQLSFKGQVNKKFGYEIQADKLDNYGVYLARQSSVAQNYTIKLQLKHILGVLKVAELVEGDFCCAMECISEDSAVCFLFTKAINFQFNIGVASVYFENKDADLIDANQIAGVVAGPAGGRLRRAENAGENQVPNEEAASSNLHNQEADPVQDGNEEDELKKEAVSPKKGKKANQEGSQGAEGSAGEQIVVKESASAVKAKGQVDQPMVDEETKQQEGVEGEGDSQGADNEGSDAGSAGGEKDDLQDEQRAKEKRLKKEKFYDEVDQEEFF